MSAPSVAIPFDPTAASWITSGDTSASALPTLAPDTTSYDPLAAFYSSPTAAMGGAVNVPQVITPPGTGTTAGDTSSTSDLMSGLGSIFGAVGTAVTQSYRAINAPTGPQVLRPGVGGLVYNPATGQYVSSGGFPVGGLGMGSNTMMLLLLLVVAFFIFRR